MLIRTTIVAATAALALAVQAVQADQGDPERGEEIAYTCSGCHGIPHHVNVYPTYRVPKLGGQSHGYIVNALQAYRAGERRHATMEAQANTLSDQDIHDIAAYFISLTAEDDS